MMTPESSTDSWPRSPVWFRQSAVLHKWTYVVIGMAATAEITLVGFGHGGLVMLAGLLVTLAGAALAWWYPWPGLLLSAAGGVLAAVLGGNPTVMWSMTVFTLFSFTLRGGPAVRGTLFTGLVLYTAVVIADRHNFGSVAALAAQASAVAGGASGAALRIHQQYWRSLEQRAADAVATRESEATRRVIQERLRIARDLHDVVGHQVAVVSMHLGVAEVSLPSGAAPARLALESARTAVRSVLSETQHILHVLRRDSTAEDAVAPALAGLPDLVDSFRRIGLRVECALGELPVNLDPAVSMTAFRIVQEALTNAHRHGNGAARLSVTAQDGWLLVDVTNERRHRADRAGEGRGSGYGLVGVRERVASAGGRLSVTDDGRGPFRLSVALLAEGSDLR